ncbi:hypothetical protein GF420_08435 [candidate division GN15 bacterium]|nr:hypothetical protein [candidate division GN15 bacterium]
MRKWILLLVALAPLVSSTPGSARHRLGPPLHNTTPYIAQAGPGLQEVRHDVGNIVLSITNYGVFAAQDDDGLILNAPDVFTGEPILACEYPKRSGTQYAYAGAFWIGAVVGSDTLVSVGSDGWTPANEMFPDEAPFGDIIRRSIIDPESPEYEGAISEQDFIAVYTDTWRANAPGLVQDYFGRPHIPIGIEITQRSFAWSYPYADDFVLFDYAIRNITTRRLSKVYMGIYIDADVGPAGQTDLPGDLSPGAQEFQDDICGFREANLETLRVGNTDVEYIDTVNFAWIADVTGDLDDVGRVALPSVTGTRIVRTPAEELDVSFNWWIGNGDPTRDFGPQAIESYRNYTTGGTGTPEGDINKYHVLRNREFDYDQIYTADIPPNDSVWLTPPASLAQNFANGFDTRYLLSFGPFTIDPGQTLPVSFAYVGGENFHTDAANGQDNLNNGYNPDLYYQNLNFNNVSSNARWASWVYDNPGVDTDNDGYAGRSITVWTDTTFDTTVFGQDSIVIDTSFEGDSAVAFYQGDGIPDFRGASPPPAPELWLTPEVGRLRVRFNGQRSETTRDVFSQEYDFEGYKVYLARDDRATSYTLLASYDRQNYNKLIYNAQTDDFQLIDNPYTLTELQLAYGDADPSWNPELYTRTNPYFGPIDSVFAFEPQGFNRSEFGVTTPIRKRFDNWQELYPPDFGLSGTDSVPDSLKFLLTDDGYFKYYEYEYTIDNLLPTVPYYVNVTSTDYGSPSSGLPSLESSKTVNAATAYALDAGDPEAEGEMEVYVWPNPYRADAAYLERGFEGRFSRFAQPIPDRERRIHFANLPHRCTIRIFTLDGDLVQEFEHDKAPGDPTAMHAEWDMITRNTQMVVSGIYYWVVETPHGRTQIGKLVIVM